MHENIYRQVGSPEVDKAWEDLGVDCMPTFLDYLFPDTPDCYSQIALG